MEDKKEKEEETTEPELIKKGRGRPKGSLGKKPNKFSRRRGREAMRQFRAREDLKKRRAAGDLGRKPKSSGHKRGIGVNKDKTAEIAKATELADALTTEKHREFEKNSVEIRGLTDHQKQILRLKMRGIPQTTIAKIMGVSQPYISQEMKRIREIFKEKGKTIDQDLVVGNTITLYEEVEEQAWQLYAADKNVDKLKALSLIVNARKENIKLLMDLGKIERIGTSSEVKITVSPFLQKWKQEENTKEIAKTAIVSQLPALEAPEPPEEEEYIEAEVVEDLEE